MPGIRSLARRNGVEVGQAPAQMPQATQFEALTTASCSKGRPSLRGCMETALNGQSSVQRVQPLQFFRSTAATGARRSGGSQGRTASIMVMVTVKAQRAPLDQRSISG
jgi:hypothetical protein